MSIASMISDSRVESLRADGLRLDSARLDSARLDTRRLDSVRLDTRRLDTLELDTLEFDSVQLDAESALATAERALYVDGDLATARSGFSQAYALAEDAADGPLMAAAALGLGGLWVNEHRPVADAAGVEARQWAALSFVDPGSTLALRLRARLAAEADYRSGGHERILPVVDEARDAGDPVALAEALSLAHHCLLGPDHAVTRVRLADQLLRAGSRTGRPSDLAMGLLWRTADLFTLGDHHAERSFAELSASGQADRNGAVRYVVSAMRVMLSIRSGRLAEAEMLAERCAEQGRLAGDADALGWYGGQLVAIRWYQGRIGELVGTLSEIANSPILSAVDNTFVAALAVAAATTGDTRRAVGALARLRGSDLGHLPRSGSWLAAINGAVEAASILGDTETAARAYDLLLPHARLPMMASIGVACFGSTHHALGVAALTTGDAVRAVGHFEQAIEQNTALGHWPAATVSRHRLSQALRARGERGDARRAEEERAAAAQESAALGMALPEAEPGRPLALVWRSTGRSPAEPLVPVCTQIGRRWRIEIGDRCAVVDDSVGVRYLATLIANPAVEIPAIDLAEPQAPGGGSPDLAESAMSGQAVLDDVALRQLRSRLRDLAEEAEEAEALNDAARADRLRAEADWLVDELQAATGLGGRSRRFSDGHERARIAVGKAIRRALQRISAADAVIGDQLRGAIQTGMRCCYRPEQSLAAS